MRNDAEILTEIAAELRETYKHNRKLSGIIYFHRISDPRMEGSAIKQLKIFRELCGDDSGTLRNVILATNRWDRLESEEVGIRRQAELEKNPRFWKSMCLKGSQVARFEGTTESALQLIRLVMRNTPLPLKIQQEMVDENKPLVETGAGRFVDAEIDKLRREHEQTLAAIKEEMQLALREKDKDMQILLREESERSKKEIDELRRQQELMNADNEKAMSEERELRKQERERMENEVARLKADIDARGQAEKTKLKKMEDEQLELAFQSSKLQLEKEKARAIEQLYLQREQVQYDQAQRGQRQHEREQREREQREREQREHEQREQEQREELLRDEQDLKNAGYDPQGRKNSATNALSEAVRKRKDLRIIRLLLAKGANPTSCIVQPRFAHRSALHVAAEVGYVGAIGIMTETASGAIDLDILDSNGDTALSWAASSGHGAVVNMLLAKGANPDTTNRFGRTPLILAAKFGNEAAVLLLLAKGAKLDITDNDSNTALICAAQNGYEAIVRQLLTNGAKHDIKNIHGETALSLATKHAHGSVVSLLRWPAAQQRLRVSIQSAGDLRLRKSR